MGLVQYIIIISLAALFIAGARQIIGFKDLGFINGLILTLLLFRLGNILIWFLLIFILLILTYLINFSFKSVRLLKIPKHAFFLIFIGFFVVFLKSVFSAYTDYKINLDDFDLVLFVVVSNRFVHEFNISNLKKVLFRMIQALLPVILIFGVLNIPGSLRLLETYYYYFIPLFMVITLFFGRYTGLRFTETKRFYNMLR